MRIIPDSNKGFGEYQTKELIKKLKSHTSEVAFWSVHNQYHPKKEFSDIDYLLIMKRGIFCIEVKGGKPVYSNGKFTYQDQEGNKKTKNENPAQQVLANKRDLKDKIEEKFPQYKNKICFAHGIFFPDLNWDFNQEEGFEMSNDIIFDRNMFAKGETALKDFINKIFTSCEKETVYKNSIELTPQIISELREYIRPNYDFAIPLRDSQKFVYEEIIKMTSVQLKFLEQIEANRRVKIDGPAGSGKTLMAKKIADEFTARGLKACYLIRNENWYEFIKDDFISIGIDVICLEKKFDVDSSYDVIIVDEGQDLATEESIEIFEKLVSNSNHKIRVYWFMDSLGQGKLYDDTDLELLDICLDGYVNFPLSENCRNPKRIIEDTNKLTGTHITNIISSESPKPEYIYLKDDSIIKHAEELEKRLDFLIDEFSKLDDICIISFSNSDQSCVESLSESYKSSILPKNTVRKSDTGKISFFDVRAFKGQEIPHIIIVDIFSSDEPEKINNLLYCAMTRPTHTLCSISSNADYYIKTKT